MVIGEGGWGAVNSYAWALTADNKPKEALAILDKYGRLGAADCPALSAYTTAQKMIKDGAGGR